MKFGRLKRSNLGKKQKHTFVAHSWARLANVSFRRKGRFLYTYCLFYYALRNQIRSLVPEKNENFQNKMDYSMD
jgi:hypothetical protein